MTKMRTPNRRLWVWLFLGLVIPLLLIYLTLLQNASLSRLENVKTTSSGPNIPEVPEDIFKYDTVYDDHAAAFTIDDSLIIAPLMPNDDSHEEIAKSIKNRILGRMKYYVPNKMKIGIDSIAFVTLSKSELLSVLDAGLPKHVAHNAIIKDDIRLSNKVKVQLVDPTKDNFIIEPIGSEVQIVTDSTSSVWRWSVQPIESGTFELFIIVTNDYSNGSVTQTIDLAEPDFNRIVVVEGSIAYVLSKFWGKNWQYFMGTFLIPIGIYIYNSKKKKREDSKKQQDEAERNKKDEEKQGRIGF